LAKYWQRAGITVNKTAEEKVFGCPLPAYTGRCIVRAWQKPALDSGLLAGAGIFRDE